MSAVEFDEQSMSVLTDEEQAAIRDQADPEEVAALQRIASGDDDDDDDGDEAAAAPVEGKAEPAAATPAPAATPAADTPAAAAPAAEPVAEPVAQADGPVFKGEPLADIEARQADLTERQATLRAQFKAGEIDIDEFDAKQVELSAERDSLTAARATAQALDAVGQQTNEYRWRQAIGNLFDTAAAQAGGIDYRQDADKAGDLDTFVRALAAKDENANRSMQWFLSEAHKRVMALHGVAVAPAAPPAPTAKADAVKDAMAKRKAPIEDVPKTLAHVPGGDGPGDVGSEFADLDGLDGEALETALARMSATDREKFARGL